MAQSKAFVQHAGGLGFKLQHRRVQDKTRVCVIVQRSGSHRKPWITTSLIPDAILPCTVAEVHACTHLPGHGRPLPSKAFLACLSQPLPRFLPHITTDLCPVGRAGQGRQFLLLLRECRQVKLRPWSLGRCLSSSSGI